MILALSRPLAALTLYNPYGFWVLLPWIIFICRYSDMTTSVLACLAALSLTAWLNLRLLGMKHSIGPRIMSGLAAILLLMVVFYILALVAFVIALGVFAVAIGISIIDLARREDWYHYCKPPQAW
jgi:hypothetical protein